MTMKIVTNSKLVARTEPNENSSKTYTYHNNDIVDIDEVFLNWGKTDKGWINISSLFLVEPIVKTIKEKTTIRKNPDNSATKVGRYDKNTKVIITQVIENWYRTNKGWIISSSLE